MQIYFDVAADVAKIGTELQDQLTHAEAGDEAFVTANDNALQWPFIPFPEGRYAFFEAPPWHPNRSALVITGLAADWSVRRD